MKDNEECPGEIACVEDKINGECGRTGRTLEQHCHSDMSNGGCRLYHTKPNTIPIEYLGFCEAIFVCRARQNAGLDLSRLDLPYWAERAYILGNAIYNRVEGEDHTESKPKNQTDYAIQGKGNSETFALIEQYMKDMQGKRGR